MNKNICASIRDITACLLYIMWLPANSDLLQSVEYITTVQVTTQSNIGYKCLFNCKCPCECLLRSL